MDLSTHYRIETLENRAYLALPSPWLEADIGSPGAAGSGTLSGGTFTLKGAGDISGTADKLRYAYQKLSGDGYVIARIADIQSNDPLAKAGVMIRENLTVGSKFADMVVRDGGAAQFHYRLSPSYKIYEQTKSGINAPTWVKLVRIKNAISGYTSSDGSNWTLAGTETVSMGANIFIGLTVTSHTSSLATGVFSNVIIPQNIVNFGASTAAANNTTAITNAISAAGNSGNEIYVPAGKFKHSGTIQLGSNKKLFGAGAFGVNPRDASQVSELVAFNNTANQMSAPIRLTGSGAQVFDLKVSEIYTGDRLQSDTSVPIYADRASNFAIRRVEISGSASAGMMITHASTNGMVSGNKVHGTLADGIHMTNGANLITVEKNTVFDTGDDLIAAVGYDGKIDPNTGLNWLSPSNITIRDNVVSNTGKDHGRGIAAVGAKNILIDSNTITDAPHTGIIIVSEDAYESLAGDGIVVTRNKIINPNTQNLSGSGGNHGGIYLGGRNGFPITNVTIGSATDPSMGNTITNAKGQGINVSTYTSNIKIFNNTIDKTTGWGIRVNSSAAVSIGSNTIKRSANHGIYVHGANTGAFSIASNVLQDINSSNSSNNDAINVATGSTFSSLTVTGNSYTNPANYTVNRFIEVHFPAASVTGNTTNTGKSTYVGV